MYDGNVCINVECTLLNSYFCRMHCNQRCWVHICFQHIITRYCCMCCLFITLYCNRYRGCNFKYVMNREIIQILNINGNWLYCIRKILRNYGYNNFTKTFKFQLLIQLSLTITFACNNIDSNTIWKQIIKEKQYC